MNGEFDLSRDVAEKILKRAMTPLREIIDENRDDHLNESFAVELDFQKVREIDRDLGALGLALANRYNEQEEYRVALEVMSAENVRLHGVLEGVVELTNKYKKEAEDLAGALAKNKNVTDKLKELRPVGDLL
jgi:hypothetical protein